MFVRYRPLRRGDRWPAERDLAAEYGVAYDTIRPATSLLAPGGRLVVMDSYPAGADRSPARRMLHRAVPLRPRLHALAAQALTLDLIRRGPATAWQIYRLTTRPAWLDHRVSDRFFSRAELVRCCDALFPGYRLDILGGPRSIGLVWDFA